MVRAPGGLHDEKQRCRLVDRHFFGIAYALCNLTNQLQVPEIEPLHIVGDLLFAQVDAFIFWQVTIFALAHQKACGKKHAHTPTSSNARLTKRWRAPLGRQLRRRSPDQSLGVPFPFSSLVLPTILDANHASTSLGRYRTLRKIFRNLGPRPDTRSRSTVLTDSFNNSAASSCVRSGCIPPRHHRWRRQTK